MIPEISDVVLLYTGDSKIIDLGSVNVRKQWFRHRKQKASEHLNQNFIRYALPINSNIWWKVFITSDYKLIYIKPIEIPPAVFIYKKISRDEMCEYYIFERGLGVTIRHKQQVGSMFKIIGIAKKSNTMFRV